ncbi:MAG TPA: type II secretion system major pseudopilin GspG [Bryobacteraceae bacterium]|nr:type II secretion system major pseudopilin GspG [Bryobacteraceae bacterium]
MLKNFWTREAGRDENVARRPGGRPHKGDAGVTLIEMLVVVTIIALFAALVLPKMMGSADKARKTQAKAQINAYLTALGSYKLDTGVYPTTEQGLQALRVKPENVNNWQGPYVQKDIDMDPWQHPYVYKYPGDHGDDPDIICYGGDGQPGGEGLNADIVSWKN